MYMSTIKVRVVKLSTNEGKESVPVSRRSFQYSASNSVSTASPFLRCSLICRGKDQLAISALFGVGANL